MDHLQSEMFQHCLHWGPISFVERTVDLALGYSAVSEQSRPVQSRLKTTTRSAGVCRERLCSLVPQRWVTLGKEISTKEPGAGRKADFPELLCRGSNTTCGLQFQRSGSWLVGTGSCRSGVLGSDLGFVPVFLLISIVSWWVGMIVFVTTRIETMKS